MKKLFLLNSNRYKLLALLLSFLILLVLVLKQSRSNSEKGSAGVSKTPTEISAEAANQMQALKQKFIQRVTISGNIQPARKTIITASYRGYVKKMYVSVGDRVEPGQAVASVVTSLTTEEKVFPLRAPFGGKVVQVGKFEGEFVRDMDPTDFIARIDDLSSLFVAANAPEIDRVRLRIDQEAEVKASAIVNRSYKAKIIELSLAAKQADYWQRSTVVEFPVRLLLLDPDENVKPGMSALIDVITIQRENVLQLRHEFIGKTRDQFFVTLLNGESRTVTLGDQNDESAEILTGISEGDWVKKVDFGAGSSSPP